MWSFVKNFFVIIVSTIILLLIGIYNGYPLVTSDSGAYINNAFHFQVPYDRPIFYSLFIKACSIINSLWIVIIIQCFILSYLLNSFLLKAFPILHSWHRLLIITITTLVTSISWYSSQVMPDIFTSVVLLTSILYLFDCNKYERFLVLLIYFFAILNHNSNLITSLLYCICVIIICLIFLRVKKYLKRSIVLLLVSILAWCSVCMVNLYAGYGFIPSKSSHVFIMGKLVENGILKEYLNEHCATNEFKLCAFINDLPIHAWDFVWDGGGAFVKTGGWDSSKNEYTKIIKGTLIETKYLMLHVKASISSTFTQVQLTDIGDGLWPYLDRTNPFWKIQENYPNELNEYLVSKQNKSQLVFGKINILYRWILIGSLFVALLIMIKTRDKFSLLILALIVLFALLNAFTTATFANILARLNSRDIWLIPFFCISVIVNFPFRQFSLTYKNKLG